MGVSRIIDLSATPFFLRGSGYAEGTLFPWTMSDFSLMDAIESGIVKLPRVPIADNPARRRDADVPKLMGTHPQRHAEVWAQQSNRPSRSRHPGPLATALEALYGHYEKNISIVERQRIDVPPCFIVVCKQHSSSKVVYDYISVTIERMPMALNAGCGIAQALSKF